MTPKFIWTTIVVGQYLCFLVFVAFVNQYDVLQK